jgi:hypothetical protein
MVRIDFFATSESTSVTYSLSSFRISPAELARAKSYGTTTISSIERGDRRKKIDGEA